MSKAFEGMKDATRGYASNPLTAGKYIARIDDNDFFDTDSKGEMWKITATILASESSAHKAGEVVHIFFGVGQTKIRKQIFQRNLKGYLAGVLGCADEDVDDAACELACSDDSPMTGLFTTITAKNQTGKNTDDAGNPKIYTVYGFGESLSDAEVIDAIGEETFTKLTS